MALRIPEPAQVRGMQYAFSKARIALFMEMRLGKSMVVIRWARQHECARVLVITPNDTVYDWRNELILEGVAPRDIYVLEGSGIEKLWTAEEVDTGWVIVNYEAIRSVKRKNKKTQMDTGVGILKLPWDAIILDESTAIRNPRAATTKTLLRHTGHIPYRALMSGLPNPHSELDYFCQMLFLHGDFMGFHNYWAFRERLYTPDVRGWDWRPKKDTTERVRTAVHQSAFILSRKDAGVGKRVRTARRYVTMTPSQKRLYQGVEKNFEAGNLETLWAPTRELWLARLAGGFHPDRAEHPEMINPGKVHIIQHLLDNDLRNDQVVIWFRFNAELDAVAEALKRDGVTYRCIKGGQGADGKRQNQQFKEEFQRGEAQVILMQAMMGKFGWNLSCSSTAIYYSNVYDWEIRAQTQDRILDVRKHDPLLLIDLVTRGTVDEDVVDVLQDRKVTSQLFNSRFKERMLEGLATRYGRRILPGDTAGKK